MSDKKPNKEKVLSELMFELEKGSDRATCLAKIVKKWQISTRTFDRHWKNANERYLERQNLTNKKLLDTKLAKESEALELAINNKNEHAKKMFEEIERLSTITAGKNVKVGGELIVATFTDEIRAKAEIRAIRKQIGDWYGFNAPKKQEVKVEQTGVDFFTVEQ